jgi:hypothetical protein
VHAISATNSAKAASRPGQHDHSDFVIALGFVEAGAHFLFHGGGPGIQFIRTIQRDGCDSIRDFVDRFLRWHGHSPGLAAVWIPRTSAAPCLAFAARNVGGHPD